MSYIELQQTININPEDCVNETVFIKRIPQMLSGLATQLEISEYELSDFIMMRFGLDPYFESMTREIHKKHLATTSKPLLANDIDSYIERSLSVMRLDRFKIYYTLGSRFNPVTAVIPFLSPQIDNFNEKPKRTPSNPREISNLERNSQLSDGYKALIVDIFEEFKVCIPEDKFCELLPTLLTTTRKSKWKGEDLALLIMMRYGLNGYEKHARSAIGVHFSTKSSNITIKEKDAIRALRGFAVNRYLDLSVLPNNERILCKKKKLEAEMLDWTNELPWEEKVLLYFLRINTLDECKYFANLPIKFKAGKVINPYEDRLSNINYKELTRYNNYDYSYYSNIHELITVPMFNRIRAICDLPPVIYRKKQEKQYNLTLKQIEEVLLFAKDKGIGDEKSIKIYFNQSIHDEACLLRYDNK